MQIYVFVMMYYFQLFLHIALIQCTRGKMSDFMLNLITTKSILKLSLKIYEYIFNCKTIIPFQIFVSKKWGFTKFEREEFEELRASGRVKPDGSHCKYMPEHGPLAAWCKIQAELAGI